MPDDGSGTRRSRRCRSARVSPGCCLRGFQAHVDVRVHRVLAEQVDPKLLACLGKPHETVETDNVGEYTTALVEMSHPQELQRHVSARSIQHAVASAIIEHVDVLVLMM